MLLTAKSCLADRFCSTELSSSVVSMEKAMTAPWRRRTFKTQPRFRRLRMGAAASWRTGEGIEWTKFDRYSIDTYPHSRSPMGTPMPGPVLPRMAALSSWYL